MLGLALEGGGAKGAYHMGAVKAFFEEGYQFDGITGTSIGAINGAIIAQGDFETGYRLWENMDTALLFDIEEMQKEKILNRQFDKEALAYLVAQIKAIIENKGIDTGKIRAILDELIDEEKLRRSKIDFGIVTVSMPDFEPVELYKEDIPQGKIVDYIMASANVPIFKIEPIDGKFYIDGAFYDNCPVNLLVRKGYKDIIAVRTLGLGKNRKLEDETVKLRTLVPSESLGTILNFDNTLIQTNLKMGYYDALRQIKGLIGKRYYLEPLRSELFFKCLWNLSDETVDKIRRLMVLPKMESKRLLFEKILPHLFSLLNLPATASYEDILIGVLEHAATSRGIDRFEIKTVKSLLGDLKAETVENQTYFSNHRTRFTSLFSKEAVLNAVSEELVNALRPEQLD